MTLSKALKNDIKNLLKQADHETSFFSVHPKKFNANVQDLSREDAGKNNQLYCFFTRNKNIDSNITNNKNEQLSRKTSRVTTFTPCQKKSKTYTKETSTHSNVITINLFEKDEMQPNITSKKLVQKKSLLAIIKAISKRFLTLLKWN